MVDTPQYWVVGANWSGDDKAQAFFRRGYWELGWDDADQPKLAARRDQIQPGDRIAVKTMKGRGATTIDIRGIGIVKEVGGDKRVYVDWLLRDFRREVPSKGCYAAIHGPFTVQKDASWLGQVFRI